MMKYKLLVLLLIAFSVQARFTQVDPHWAKYPSFSPYNYAANNPLKYVDPDGQEIQVGAHEVAMGSYHTTLIIIPDNQQAYINNSHFTNRLSDGRLYMTLGAGPESGMLVNGINRERDLDISIKMDRQVVDINSQSEDVVISSLISGHNSYKNKLDYDLFPAQEGKGVWYIADDSYNSNSYTSGLLNSTGLNAPAINVNVPGYTKPVPADYFTTTNGFIGPPQP